MSQKPSIGRIVHYRDTAEQAEQVNQRRKDAFKNLDDMRENRPGFQAHVGNPLADGEAVALVVTAVWSNDLINGKALLDGNDSLWVMSVSEGDGIGEWHWPPRVA